jgi:hypothetical protein
MQQTPMLQVVWVGDAEKQRTGTPASGHYETFYSKIMGLP